MTSASEPRILIVDDDPVIREVLQSYVQAQGIRADIAESGVDCTPKTGEFFLKVS